MLISIIAAVAENNVIGKDNQLLWHLPADMNYFKEKTIRHCVIMGRKSYESIPKKFRPLPNRTSIVITRQKNYNASETIVVGSMQEAIKKAKQKWQDEIFIIGGAEIYKLALPIAHRIYLTEVHQQFDGDVFFPEIDKNSWKEISRIDFKSDEKNKFNYSFCVLEKLI